MSLIEAYEEQYQGLVKSINEKLDRLAKLGKSSGRKSRKLCDALLVINVQR
jgi:hypothetical protein